MPRRADRFALFVRSTPLLAVNPVLNSPNQHLNHIFQHLLVGRILSSALLLLLLLLGHFSLISQTPPPLLVRFTPLPTSWLSEGAVLQASKHSRLVHGPRC